MLAVIALVVLGPKRLPEAARTAGKWIGQLRKLTSRFQEEMGGVLAEPKDAITAAVGDLHREVGSWRNEVAGLGRSMTTAVGTTPAAAMSQPASWTNGAAGANGTNGSGTYPAVAPGASDRSVNSVSSGLVPPGFPPLPPAPDDPSLN